MNRLVFAGSELVEFRRELLDDAHRESAGVVVARPGRGREGRRFVVLNAIVASDDDYLERTEVSAILQPAFIARALKVARDERASLFLTHTHPSEAWPAFSRVDAEGERGIASTLYARAEEGPHGSLVFGTEGFSARLLDPTGNVTDSIDRILEASSHIGLNEADVQSSVDAMFDRNVRAFGTAGQQVLHSLHVAVVGVGGTGSFVVEELARLGVGRLTLIDDENVELTNLNRLVGAALTDVGRAKVDVAADVARRARPSIGLEPVQGSILDEKIARRLIDCDAVFCCTDSHGSRAVINQVAYQYLIPTFDVGVRIDADGDSVTAVTSRVQMLAPGLPCLACYPLLSPEAVRRDLMTVEAREQDPYIVGFHEPQPAVISINGSATSSAVTMFLTAVTGLPSTARHLVGRPLEGTVRAAVGTPRPDCVVCSSNNAFRRADSWPLMWRS